jgi:hypothetical protein
MTTTYDVMQRVLTEAATAGTKVYIHGVSADNSTVVFSGKYGPKATVVLQGSKLAMECEGKLDVVTPERLIEMLTTGV